MKRTVAIQDVHYVHGKPRHNQVLHVYHNWTDEELADEANVVRQNDIEFRRLKRFIESHDEILAVLREAVRVLGPRDRYDFVIKAEALIKQLNGEEAQ